MSTITHSPAGGALRQIAAWLSMPRNTVRYPAPRLMDGLDDHLLRDIGRARGAGGRDRRHGADI
jgi:hypothetical protein